MNSKEYRDLNELRASKLAYIQFVKKPDLIVEESASSLFDFLIDIGNKKKQTGRLFGVEVRVLSKAENKSLKRYENIAIPAFFLFFNKEDDTAYYNWIKRPLDNGELKFITEIHTHAKFESKSLDEIITAIKNWYSIKANGNKVITTKGLKKQSLKVSKEFA
jgi:hypothetical protein